MKKFKGFSLIEWIFSKGIIPSDFIHGSVNSTSSGTVDETRVREIIQSYMDEHPIYFSSQTFTGDGLTPETAFSAIGGGSGGGSGSSGTTTDLTFNNPLALVTTYWTNAAGHTYHEASPANTTLSSTKSGRILADVTADSDWIMGFGITSNETYQTLDFGFQLSVFQGNIRLMQWVAGTQTFIKNTTAGYKVGLFRDSSNNIILQESSDGTNWNDLVQIGTLTGILNIIASMDNNGKLFNPKITIY